MYVTKFFPIRINLNYGQKINRFFKQKSVLETMMQLQYLMTSLISFFISCIFYSKTTEAISIILFKKIVLVITNKIK